MTNSLRDQLLGLGFAPPAKPERPAAPKPGSGPRPDRRDGKAAASNAPRPGQGPRQKPHGGKPAGARPGGGPTSAVRPPPGRPGGRPANAGKPRSQADIDLAKAYAIRAQREKDERIAAEAARQEEARLRREARARLAETVKDKGLNAADADIARHFEYGGKIKRIYVTADQLKALNAGELGVLQLDGRYLLVDAAMLAQAEAIFPPAVALKVDPTASAEDDPYADPQYQVPDDLVW